MPARGSKWGNEHNKLRAQLIAHWRPGDPCARCGKPMMGPASQIHLGHDDSGRADSYRGLEHARCNTSAGGSVGGQRRSRPDLVRECPYCHAPFTAQPKTKIACCRAHAYALKRGDAPLPKSGRKW